MMEENIRRQVSDDSWIKIFQLLPYRIINLYCSLLCKKTTSKPEESYFTISRLAWFLSTYYSLFSNKQI
jgi:hypothetical protein